MDTEVSQEVTITQRAAVICPFRTLVWWNLCQITGKMRNVSIRMNEKIM